MQKDINQEEEMMNEEVENEEKKEVEEIGETEIIDYVKQSFAEGGEAAGLTGDEAIDAVIKKLEAMKTGTGKSMLGGLGGETMSLPEDRAIEN